MKRLLLLLILAALTGCGSTVPSSWPASPPPAKESGHEPWGDNWFTKTR